MSSSLTRMSELPEEAKSNVNALAEIDFITFAPDKMYGGDLEHWLRAVGADEKKSHVRSSYPRVFVISPKLVEGFSPKDEWELCYRYLDCSAPKVRVLIAYFEKNIRALVNEYEFGGRSLLNCAVGTGRDDIITWALDRGASVNATNLYGYYPFVNVAASISPAVAKRLLPTDRTKKVVTQLFDRCCRDLYGGQVALLPVWLQALIHLEPQPGLLVWWVRHGDFTRYIPMYLRALREIGCESVVCEELDHSTYGLVLFWHQETRKMQLDFNKVCENIYREPPEITDFSLYEMALLYGDVDAFRYFLTCSNHIRLRYHVVGYLIHRNPVLSERDWENTCLIIAHAPQIFYKATSKLVTNPTYAVIFKEASTDTLKRLIQRIIGTYILQASRYSGHGSEGFERALLFFTQTQQARSEYEVWELVSHLLLIPQKVMYRNSFRWLLVESLVYQDAIVDKLSVSVSYHGYDHGYPVRGQKKSDLIREHVMSLGLLIKMRYLPSLQAQEPQREDTLYFRLTAAFNQATYHYLILNSDEKTLNLDGVQKAAENWQALSVNTDEKRWLSVLKTFLSKGNTLRKSSHRALVVEALLGDAMISEHLQLNGFIPKHGASDDDIRKAKLDFVRKQLGTYCRRLDLAAPTDVQPASNAGAVAVVVAASPVLTAASRERFFPRMVMTAPRVTSTQADQRAVNRSPEEGTELQTMTRGGPSSGPTGG